MYKFILCENDSKEAEHIISVLHQCLNSTDTEIAYFQTGKEMLAHLHEFQHAIFLLDILLDDMDGIEIAKIINDNSPSSSIIYITGFLNKACDIYDTRHCYFIYKPELERRLPKALHKAIEHIDEEIQTLPIHHKGGITVLSMNQIIYLERFRRTTLINTSHHQYTDTRDFSEFSSIVPSYFIQCHRSYMINLNHVKEYSRCHFITRDDKLIPIGRTYEKKAREQFHEYLFQKVN